jgi:hypothetical protein
MTIERITAAADALANAGWITVDHDTEEGFIRRYIADDEAGDNIFKGALSRALLAQSPVLRAALLEEILKLPRVFSEREQQLVDELANSLPDEQLVAPAPVPSSTASTQAFERRHDTVPTPSEHRSNPVASEQCSDGKCIKCRSDIYSALCETSAIKPPSMTNSAAVAYDDSSLARNSTNIDTS